MQSYNVADYCTHGTRRTLHCRECAREAEKVAYWAYRSDWSVPDAPKHADLTVADFSSSIPHVFSTGAKRDRDERKPDFEGALSPLVVQAYGAYLLHHRRMKDGSLRRDDDWQKGIPLDTYMKSGWRHFFDWWCAHRKLPSREGVVFAVCGLLFNLMGYLHEMLKADPLLLERSLAENSTGGLCGALEPGLTPDERYNS